MSCTPGQVDSQQGVVELASIVLVGEVHLQNGKLLIRSALNLQKNGVQNLQQHIKIERLMKNATYITLQRFHDNLQAQSFGQTY